MIFENFQNDRSREVQIFDSFYNISKYFFPKIFKIILYIQFSLPVHPVFVFKKCSSCNLISTVFRYGSSTLSVAPVRKKYWTFGSDQNLEPRGIRHFYILSDFLNICFRLTRLVSIDESKSFQLNGSVATNGL